MQILNNAGEISSGVFCKKSLFRTADLRVCFFCGHFCLKPISQVVIVTGISGNMQRRIEMWGIKTVDSQNHKIQNMVIKSKGGMSGFPFGLYQNMGGAISEKKLILLFACSSINVLNCNVCCNSTR